MPGRGAVVVNNQEVIVWADALAAGCRRLHATGLLAGREGNCSVRLRDGSLLITASGIDKSSIGPQHVLRRRADGGEVTPLTSANVTEGASFSDSPLRPSSEMEMHVGIYRARADVMAVVHAHPPVATGFATAGRSIPANVLPELPVVVGPVALVAYARPGTSALAEAILPFLAAHEVFLLANHGVTTVGRSLTDAITRLESVEQAARILLVAELLGGARVLPTAEALSLATLWRRTDSMAPSGHSFTDALS